MSRANVWFIVVTHITLSLKRFRQKWSWMSRKDRDYGAKFLAVCEACTAVTFTCYKSLKERRFDSSGLSPSAIPHFGAGHKVRGDSRLGKSCVKRMKFKVSCAFMWNGRTQARSRLLCEMMGTSSFFSFLLTGSCHARTIIWFYTPGEKKKKKDVI